MDARRVAGLATRVLAALVSVGVLVASGLGWSLQQRTESASVTSNVLARAAPTPVGEPFTALLVGLDARTDAAGNPLPPEVLDALHAGPDEGQLHTDTMILLRVPATASGAPAVAISIPRDSFVPIAGGNGTHKINSAYRRGMDDAEKALTAQGVTGAELDRRGREAGRQTLVDTVEALTGMSIDHFAEINLAGFVELTEALGGVPVCLNKPVRDSYSGIDLPAGEQYVTGAGALAFVRQRHGLEGGDLDRIARQQAFIAGLAQRLQTAGALADTDRLNQLAGVVARHVVLDRGWKLDEALTQLRRFTGADLVFQTIPTVRPDLETPVDGIAVEVDKAAVRRFVAALLAPPRPTTPPPIAAPASGAAVVQPAGVAPGSGAPTTTPRVITADGIPCVD
jgi:LCP family protein required for cell wall assembly